MTSPILFTLVFIVATILLLLGIANLGISMATIIGVIAFYIIVKNSCNCKIESKGCHKCN